MIPTAKLERVRDLLLAQQWIFARTMPDNPHWYTLRRRFLSADQRAKDRKKSQRWLAGSISTGTRPSATPGSLQSFESTFQIFAEAAAGLKIMIEGYVQLA